LNWLNTLEGYHITYICWLKEVKEKFRVGNLYKTQIYPELSVKNPLDRYFRPTTHTCIDLEIYWLMYNVACIYYAKGMLELTCYPKTKEIKCQSYFAK